MMEQRSDEWHKIRLGKVTASRIADVMAKTKSGPSASRANYAAELVAERLSGARAETFVNAAMQRGTDLEPLARDAYSFITGNDVVEEGFVHHPTIDMAGCSPDGLIGADGLVEIKCVGTAKHIALLTGASPEGKYVKQAMWQMACTGRQWCDLTYFDDRLPVEMQLHIVTIRRDPSMIEEMEREVAAFLAEIDTLVSDLSSRYLKDAA